MYKLILPFMLLLPSMTFAGNFKCQVVDVMKVGEKGKLQKNEEDSSFGKVGEEFVVDGSTGRVIGSGMLINSDWGKPLVLRPGASGDMLLILTVNEKNHHTYSLKISTWKANMPYVYISSMWGINTGICKQISL